MSRKRQLELSELSESFKSLEQRFDDYRSSLAAMSRDQDALSRDLAFFSRHLNEHRRGGSPSDAPEDAAFAAQMASKVPEWRFQLPATARGFNALFLGSSMPVTMPLPVQRIRYKQEYETFKSNQSILSLFIIIPSIIFDLPIIPSSLRQAPLTRAYLRLSDNLTLALIVYSYFVTIVREGILVANGSRIRTWWRAHHFIVLALCLLLLLTDNERSGVAAHRLCMTSFMAFSFVVQILQARYQRRRLYVRTALGRRRGTQLDVTSAETGTFRSVSARPLLPFVFGVHIWQIYIAVILILPLNTVSWQAVATSLAFLTMGVCNAQTTVTTLVGQRRRRKALKDMEFSDTTDADQ